MKEKVPFYKVPPVPSPDQLRNSIEKLEEMQGNNPPDKRVARYQRMLPEAEDRRAGWEADKKRIQSAFSGIDNYRRSSLKSVRPKTASLEWW